MTTVFVYGTLKRGYANYRRLMADAKFLGTATTAPLYRLHDVGPFPVMVASDRGVAVAGELYEVDDLTLKELDCLEGHPRTYLRSAITLADGSTAAGYLFQYSVEKYPDCGTSWEGR